MTKEMELLYFEIFGTNFYTVAFFCFPSEISINFYKLILQLKTLFTYKLESQMILVFAF